LLWPEVAASLGVAVALLEDDVPAAGFFGRIGS